MTKQPLLVAGICVNNMLRSNYTVNLTLCSQQAGQESTKQSVGKNTLILMAM